MLRRDGNVIGNPIPTNTSSATGVFRIAAGQQKNILTKFPPPASDPSPPQFVSILGGGFPFQGQQTPPFGGDPVDGSGLTAGTLYIRIAGPRDFEEPSGTNFSRNQVVKENDGAAPVTGYHIEIESVSADFNHAGMGTVFINADQAANFNPNYGAVNGVLEDQAYLPFKNGGSAFEYEDKYAAVVLDNATGSGSPTNRFGNPGLQGLPKDCKWRAKVYTHNSAGKRSTPVISNVFDAFKSTSTNTNIDEPGQTYMDILLVGGGSSGGRVQGRGASGGGAGGAVVVVYNATFYNGSTHDYFVDIGTGGVNSSGGDTAIRFVGGGTNANVWVARGGGKGADSGNVATAQTIYNWSNASAGGCGGGAGGNYFSNNSAVTTHMQAGLTGGLAGQTSGYTQLVTNQYLNQSSGNFVFENLGGGYQINSNNNELGTSADVTGLRSVYGTYNVGNRFDNVNFAGSPGGGAGHPGGMWSITSDIGGNGKYIAWATPGISSSIPQLEAVPSTLWSFTSLNFRDGTASGDMGGYYGAGGSVQTSNQNLSKGAGGFGRFENNIPSRTHNGVTYSINAIDGTGSGGGGAFCNDNDNSRIFDGGNGGDGIVILRMHSGQYGAVYRPSISGASDIVTTAGYTYIIYRASGSFTV